MNFEYVRMSSQEEAEKYFSETGHWIVANVRQLLGWPEKKVIVYFREIPILFIPEENDKYPAVAIRCKVGISEEKARETINHFLSSLAWGSGNIVEIEAWGGGGRPYVYGKSRGARMLSKTFRITYLPDTTNTEARLALAFYREAISLEHPAYSFLSYYKIINLRFRTGETQKDWIEQKLPNVDYREAKQRLDSLRKSIGSDRKIAEYLYHSCRCAIAHADITQETVNPEDYEDMTRLRLDLPLIRGLSEILIESEFDILRPEVIYKTHPYELFGFKSFLGEESINKIKNGQTFEEAIPIPEEISLRLWGEFCYKPFEGMRIEKLTVDNGTLVIQAVSSNSMMAAAIALDFCAERIVFDPQASISTIVDDGSACWAECNLEICRFLRRYWMNGALEIWASKADKCLGFSDPFIPVNIDMSQTIKNFDQQIKTWEKEIKKRKENKEV